MAPPPRVLRKVSAEEIAASPFTALGVDAAIVRALLEEEYTQPTPIQNEVIPLLLRGRDVLACAQTGTGKTAAFTVPLLQRMGPAKNGAAKIRTLILTPTRELAAQIGDSIAAYGRHYGLRAVVIYGGVNQHRQEIALQKTPDILVATPGRLLDLIKQGFIRLDGIEFFVLDEADRMLDMGFVHDVRRVIQSLPKQGAGAAKTRQTLLFSATIPQTIEALAASLLIDPARVTIRPAVTTAEGVDQSVVFVNKADKRSMLEQVLSEEKIGRAIVFTRTKHGANRLTEALQKAGIGAAAIHGNKSQNARERALDGFRSGTLKLLIATDVAARGIDVDGVTHVINFDLPEVAESYVHRIGRTGRAGAFGRAISFCDAEERALLSDIERFIKKRLPRRNDEGGLVMSEPAGSNGADRARGGNQRRRRR